MRYAIRPALIEPLNLLFLALALALAVVAGLAAGWWTFLLGLALYVYLVYLSATDPIVRARECLRRRMPLAPRFEDSFRRIEQVQVRLDKAMEHARPQARRTLRSVRAAVADVLAEAYLLGRQATVLEDRRPVAEIEATPGVEPAAVESRCAAVPEPAAYSTDENPDNAQAAGGEKDAFTARIDSAAALLYSLASDLECVLAEIVRLPEHDPQQAEQCVAGWVQSLHLRREQLGEFTDRWEER